MEAVEMEITQEDCKLFEQACKKIIDKERLRRGIGTLGEKTVHAVLKHYIDPREQYHEQRCGNFVADILSEGEIIEIQSANFNTMRKKLDVFLKEYEVTIVYPIPACKWLIWMDEETGEITERRKSPKRGSYYRAFYELYKIKQYLKNPKLHFRFLLINMEEYRLLNGWSKDRKRGSVRYDRIPLNLIGELMITSPEDFQKLLPKELPKQFTSVDFKEKSKLTLKEAQTALNVLTYTETVKRVGKIGNRILYESNAK